METIVINIDDNSDANLILKAIKLFKGVKNVSIATDEQLENLSMLKACKVARKTKKVSKDDVLNVLA